MGLRVLNEQTLIAWHLDINPQQLPSIELHSTLTTPLREVRQLSLRNEDNGVHTNNGVSHSWMAAKGYLSLVEQLGNAYDIVPSEPETNAFKRSLKMFTALTTNEIDTLWGLRCSLFHDFALVRNDGRPNYIFNVGPRGTAAAFIRPATTPWDGRMPTSTDLPSRVTTVELNGIGDLFETVIFPKVNEKHQRNELRIRNLTLQEFQLKYFWTIAPQQPAPQAVTP